MKHAVLFITLVFLSAFVVIGWMNEGTREYRSAYVLGARTGFWNRFFGKMWQPKTVPSRGFVKPTPSVSVSELENVSDDPEIDLSNLEQELRSLDQEMNALKLDAAGR